MAEQLLAEPSLGLASGTNPSITPKKTSRLLSLDVFRGITMAGMILVNNAGDWGHKYGPLGHADWNGWTPTDLVFPSFLFIVGVAMTFSFDRRLGEGFSRLRLFEHVLRRTITLFLLGLILFSFPVWRLMGPYILIILGLWFLFHDEPPLAWPSAAEARWRKLIGWAVIGVAVIWFALDFRYFQSPHPPATGKMAALRVPGVLQRIAICYLIASIVMMFLGVRGRVMATVAILLGYWWITKHAWPVSPLEGYPVAARPEGILHAWLDARVVGRHVYTELPDPEGTLSTLGGLATCLLGVLTGSWLRSRRDDRDKLIGLFFAANLAIVAGLWMNHDVEINKKIWTSSYVLLAGGIAMHLLAMCYWLIDVKGWRRWSGPFMVFGTNAILVYFASGIVGRTIIFCRTTQPDGTPSTLGMCLKQLVLGLPTYPPGASAVTLQKWMYQHWFESHIHNPCKASLAWALAYVLFWLILLIPLYRRRIFLKV